MAFKKPQPGNPADRYAPADFVVMKANMQIDNYSIVSPEDFDVLFDEEAIIADLKTSKAEEAYEKIDQMLIDEIKKTVKSFDTPQLDQVYIIEDWWPNHTRYLEVTSKVCTSRFLSELQNLLVGNYANYRIQICVYSDLLDGSSYIGSVVLYAKRRVIDSALYDFVAKEMKLNS